MGQSVRQTFELLFFDALNDELLLLRAFRQILENVIRVVLENENLIDLDVASESFENRVLPDYDEFRTVFEVFIIPAVGPAVRPFQIGNRAYSAVSRRTCGLSI